MADRTAPAPRRECGDRIAPLVGLAGGTSGETVAMALRRRSAVPPVAGDHAARLSRSTAVALRAAAMLWFAATGSPMPSDAVVACAAELQDFDDEPPTTPSALIAHTIRTELGGPVEKLFHAFDVHPESTDAVGQTHAATMPDGRPVAVEVLHPGVGQALRTLLAGPELHAALVPLLSVVAPATTAAGLRATAGELRGRVEQLIGGRGRAATLAELAAALRDHPFVRVPAVVAELSARRVLTRARVGGVLLAEAAHREVADRDRWGEAVFRLATGGAQRLGLAVFGPDGADLRFLDGGVVALLGVSVPRRFTPVELAARADRVRAVVDGDGAALVALHAAHCAAGSDALPVSPEVLSTWHRRILGPLGRRTPATGAVGWVSDLHGAILPRQRPCTVAPLRPDCLFGTGLDTGTATVLGTLHAFADWNALREEENGAPMINVSEAKQRALREERTETVNAS